MTKAEAYIIEKWLREGQAKCLKTVNEFTSNKVNIGFAKLMLERAESFETVIEALTMQKDIEKVDEQEN
jgi:hypothetical protein